MGLKAKDADNNNVYVKTSQAGSIGDPFVIHRNIDAITAGASADIGAVADAAVVTDANGSLSAKLRGLVKWAFERMPGSLGQKDMAHSLPVVFASDQSAIGLAGGVQAIGGVKYNGPQWTPLRSQIDSADLSATIDLTVAPNAGEKVVIDQLIVSTLTAMTVTITEESTPGTTIFKVLLAANSQPLAIPLPFGGVKFPTVNKKARIQASAEGNIYVSCSYHSEA